MNAKAPSLVLDAVTLVHGDGEETVTALDDVHLTIEPGEFVAVVGPSGSGKSSLLAVAGALVPATSGSVRIGGVEFGGLNHCDRVLSMIDGIVSEYTQQAVPSPWKRSRATHPGAHRCRAPRPATQGHPGRRACAARRER